jgi:hypothetical protein
MSETPEVMYPEGTYAIKNLQTERYDLIELGECKPSDIDLDENQEIWRVLNGRWEPRLEPTRQEEVLLEIRAFAERIIELTDELF